MHRGFVAVFVGGLMLALEATETRAQNLNCSNFPSQAAAQAFLRANPSDPFNLDADNDGIACENNPAPFDRVPVPRPGPTAGPTAVVIPPTPLPPPTSTATPSTFIPAPNVIVPALACASDTAQVILTPVGGGSTGGTATINLSRGTVNGSVGGFPSGGLVTLNFPTTLGTQSFSVSAVPSSITPITGTLTGTPGSASPVTLALVNTIVAQGTLTCGATATPTPVPPSSAGLAVNQQAAFRRLAPPPPPVPFGPPPLLLPPPPPRIAAPPPGIPPVGAPAMMEPPGGVPVIPEADTLALLGGGLATWGTAALLRRRGRRDRRG